jgi:hypothetical protein
MRSSAAATVCAGPTISYRSCSRISSSNMAIRGSSSSKRTRGIRLLPCQQSVVIPHRGYPRTQSEEGSPDHRAVWLAITNATGSPVLHCCSMARPPPPRGNLDRGERFHGNVRLTANNLRCILWVNRADGRRRRRARCSSDRHRFSRAAITAAATARDDGEITPGAGASCEECGICAGVDRGFG